MNPVLLMLGVLPILITAACGAGSTGPTETRDDNFVVGESPRVVVSGDNGYIIVKSATDGTLRVQDTLSNPDDLEYETTKEGDTVSVEAKEKKTRYFQLWTEAWGGHRNHGPIKHKGGASNQQRQS